MSQVQWLRSENFQRMLWPLMALVCILLFNFFFTPGFFHIEIKDGRFFGSLVDIANRAAPVMLLAIGMTLVFATGGVDLSVGAVMAISGAIAATVIRPDYVKGVLEYGEVQSLFLVLSIPLFFSLLAGLWNGLLVAVIGIQPIIATLILMVAGRGIAQLITQGQIVVFIHEPFQYIGSGFLFGLPFPICVVIMTLGATIMMTRLTGVVVFWEEIDILNMFVEFLEKKKAEGGKRTLVIRTTTICNNHYTTTAIINLPDYSE